MDHETGKATAQAKGARRGRPKLDQAQPVAQRVRRHRQEQAAAGLVRVDLALPAAAVARLDAEASALGISRAAHLAALILRG